MIAAASFTDPSGVAAGRAGESVHFRLAEGPDLLTVHLTRQVGVQLRAALEAALGGADVMVVDGHLRVVPDRRG